MHISHRFVGFGTRFISAKGSRSEPFATPEALHENELAVDVGGVCWGHNGERLPVLDHHLRRADNYPAAACAVLHSAKRIREHFRGQRSIWLVTHRTPDYDALCASYLAVHAMRGGFEKHEMAALRLHPDGWREIDAKTARIDWYDLNLAYLPPELRWAFLLASVAAYTDNARSMVCPVTRTLSSVLYVRMERGVSYETEEGGAEFFDFVREAIQKRRLNPLFDSVFENEEEFGPELAMLDRAEQAYPRDLARARKSIVHLPVAPGFQAFYEQVQEQPLLAGHDAGPVHVDMGGVHQQHFRQADAIYLRDPQCTLFRQFARQDAANSSFGRGFLFTGIAYSGQKPGGNSTRYIFSLDPERARGAHLYPVWARLQAKELARLRSSALAPAAGGEARRGYEKRAGEEGHLFADPWFDGMNFQCTLVETPNRGTLLGAGEQSDLSDDPVTAIVRGVLEITFQGAGEYIDYTIGLEPSGPAAFTARTAPPPPRQANTYRFASVPLAEGVDPLHRGTQDSIGQELFVILHPDRLNGVPGEILSERIIADRCLVALWDAGGVAVAYTDAGKGDAVEMQDAMKEIAHLAGRVRKAIPGKHDPKELRELLVAVTRLQERLTHPGNRPLQRFFEENRFEQVLSLAHELHSTVTSEKSIQQIASVQRNTELTEILILSVYATEVAHVVAGDALHAVFPVWAVIYYAAAALLTFLFAYLLSQGREESEQKHPRKSLLLLGLWFAVLISVGGWLGLVAHDRQHAVHPAEAATPGEDQ